MKCECNGIYKLEGAINLNVGTRDIYEAVNNSDTISDLEYNHNSTIQFAQHSVLIWFHELSCSLSVT